MTDHGYPSSMVDDGRARRRAGLWSYDAATRREVGTRARRPTASSRRSRSACAPGPGGPAALCPGGVCAAAGAGRRFGRLGRRRLGRLGRLGRLRRLGALGPSPCARRRRLDPSGLRAARLDLAGAERLALRGRPRRLQLTGRGRRAAGRRAGVVSAGRGTWRPPRCAFAVAFAVAFGFARCALGGSGRSGRADTGGRARRVCGADGRRHTPRRRRGRLAARL